ARHHSSRPLCQLERPASHLGRHAPSGRIRLGPRDLRRARPPVPLVRFAGPHRVRAHQRCRHRRSFDCGRTDACDHHRRTLLVGLPGNYYPGRVRPTALKGGPIPTWQFLFVLAFTGIRGVVSLAAALAIPLTTAAGTPFPARDEILAITFIVIVVTLV